MVQETTSSKSCVVCHGMKREISTRKWSAFEDMFSSEDVVSTGRLSVLLTEAASTEGPVLGPRVYRNR